MKAETYFDKFLENIEPKKKFKEHAIEAHTRVRDYLSDDDSQFSEYVVDSFLYGSYKRHTAQGNIKDVDIALVTNFDPYTDEDKPSKVLPKLKRALNRFYKDPKSTTPNRKSVQVIDPLPDESDSELTLDIIPVVLTGDIDQKVLVPDREDDVWVESHPKGHLKFTTDLNSDDVGRGMFVPLVKIMKHWWKQHSGVEDAKPKGFWLEILAGETFDPTKNSYAEHFVQTLFNIKNRYSDYESYSSVPVLFDPGIPEEELKTSMTLAEFVHFMDAVNATLEIAEEALVNPDENQSTYLWGTIFGEEFPQPAENESLDLSSIISFLDKYIAPNEQFITRDYGIPLVDLGYQVKIDAKITQDGFRPKFLSKLPCIKKKAKLLFTLVKCTVPYPYRIKWKVKNTGKEAARIGQQRGEIVDDKGSGQKEESTLYTGHHYVECYVIDDFGRCIGWNRLVVRIP